MISMKGFFLFIVMNVFSWNSNVYAKDIAEVKSIYDLKVIAGKFVDLSDYNDQFLLITFQLPKDIVNVNHQKLISLAQKYNKKKLKVLIFLKDESNIDEDMYNQNSDILEKMNESNIEFVPNIYAQDLRNYITHASTLLYSGCTFLVNEHGNVIFGFNDRIHEKFLVDYLKPWKHTHTVYELQVKNDKGVSVKMEMYKGNVLIVSFATLTDEIEEQERRFKLLLDLALETDEPRLKILVFLVPCTRFNNKDPASLISEIDTKTEVQLFEYNAESYVLQTFIQPQNYDKKLYSDDYVIDHNGNVFIQFKRDSLVEHHIENVKTFIKVMEEDYEEPCNVSVVI